MIGRDRGVEYRIYFNDHPKTHFTVIAEEGKFRYSIETIVGRVGLVDRVGTRKLSPSASVAIALIPDAVFARISQHSTLISLIERVIGN